MNIQTIYPNWPLRNKVNALTTTRLGGYSDNPYHGLNLALHVGDRQEHVLANRSLLREKLQLSNEPKWLQQIHSNKVVNANAIESDTVKADASYSIDADTVCAVLTADCLPILFSDEQGSCVGVAHVGWRGLLNGVIQQTTLSMSVYAKPDYAWLGPAIGPNAFEVGNDVYELYLQRDRVLKSAFTVKSAGKWSLDIYKAARIILSAANISNTYSGGYCTYTDSTRFFSYRRTPRTGRMATLIWIK